MRYEIINYTCNLISVMPVSILFYYKPSRLVQSSRVFSGQSPFFPVQGVEVVLTVPTLEEAPRCCKGVAVNDLGLGQVHLMACGPHMLRQSRCRHISFLECPLVFTEAVL